MDDRYSQELELLGFLSQNGLDSKTISLLQALLEIHRSKKLEPTFSNVYDAFTEIDGGKPKSKPYVHRLLNTLIDSKVIHIEGIEGRNRRYVCDINTLASGLSFLKEQTRSTLIKEKAELDQQIKRVEEIDAGELASHLHGLLTGIRRTPTSRFLRNIEEFQRITDETIYLAAKKGDVIRTSVANAAPFVGGYTERIQRIFVAAQKGVEVRYAVPPSVLQNTALTEGEASQAMTRQILGAIKNDRSEGPGLHMRINPAGPKSHQFVGLNNQVIALWISENPPTAAWITREFNADLIDHIIKTFDDQWQQSLLVHEVLDGEMRKRVTGEKKYDIQNEGGGEKTRK